MQKNFNQKKFDLHLIKAIIGLGNPGPNYYKTRHSIGFRIVDEIAQQLGVTFNKTTDKEYTQARVTLNDDSLISMYLIKPLTFVNKSGDVIPFLQKKGVQPEEILVVHDELEKKFGHLSIKFGGGAKGHNGLRSIINFIGKDFWRLRFGISRPNDRTEVSNYVLSNFSNEEESQIPNLLQKAVNLIFAEAKFQSLE